ncbi:MAG: MaoC/PaaZ C-terminal domain-containing protein [Gammaproteobacteria bacterium]
MSPAVPGVRDKTALARMPGLGAGYLRLLTRLGGGRVAQSSMPFVSVDHWQCDAGHLARYMHFCGFRGECPPITYPQVAAMPLLLRCATQPGFPVSPLGLVHRFSRFEWLRWPIPRLAGRWKCRLVACKRTDAGLELTMETRLDDAAGPLWCGVMGMLAEPVRGMSGVGQPAALTGSSGELLFPENCGRGYARVSGDWNPIHLARIGAALFGQRRSIAHGMFSLARVLVASDFRPASRLEVTFRRPIRLPARTCWLQQCEDGGRRLQLWSVDRQHLHLDARAECARKEHE